MTAAISPGWAAKAARTASRSLYGSTITSAVVAAVTPAESGRAKVATPEPGGGQQRVHVPVVAAGKLDDLGAAGEPAGQPDRRHGRLGAGGHQSDLLHGADAGDDFLGQQHLTRTGVPNDRPRVTAEYTASMTAGMRVAEDHRPPRPDQVDVGVAVRIGDPRPSPDTMNRGVPPTDRNARTGEFTPPGVTAERPLEQRRALGLDGS